MPGEAFGTQAVGRCRRITLDRFDEQRGSLCVIDVAQHLPCEIQRAYWIFDVPTRGERADHAHREQSEVLIAVRGAFTVYCDDGEARTVHRLDSPDQALLLPPMVFHRLTDYARGSLCLVLASGPHDPTEYVNDYGEFLELIAQR